MRGLRSRAQEPETTPAPAPVKDALRSGPLAAEDVYPADPHVLVPTPTLPSDLSVVEGGQRLGELLVAEGLLRPDEVVEALRLVTPSDRKSVV